jgi:hypothetical protein
MSPIIAVVAVEINLLSIVKVHARSGILPPACFCSKIRFILGLDNYRILVKSNFGETTNI